MIQHTVHLVAFCTEHFNLLLDNIYFFFVQSCKELLLLCYYFDMTGM